MDVVYWWRSWWGEEAFELFMGSGLGFGSAIGVKGWRGNEKREKDGSVGRLTTLVWPSYRYRSHKKKKKSVSDEKLSEVCQTGGIRKLWYFKWWVMSDENWVRSDEWWSKKKKKTKQPLIILSLVGFSMFLQH